MTNGEPHHPSYLVLDRAALGLAVARPTQHHIENCERCSAHIDDVRRKRPVPDWARQVADIPPWRRRFFFAGGIVGAAVATAVALLIVLPTSEPTEPGYTTVRGAPSIGLYIKRGNRVSLWDGQQPVAAGDRLRLKVVPEEFTHVGVFAAPPSSHGPAQLLFASEITPDEENLLPRAWEVDDTPGAETLIVVLGQRPVTQEDLAARDRGFQHRSDLWIRSLRLPKESRGRDSSLDIDSLEGEP